MGLFYIRVSVKALVTGSITKWSPNSTSWHDQAQDLATVLHNFVWRLPQDITTGLVGMVPTSRGEPRSSYARSPSQRYPYLKAPLVTGQVGPQLGRELLTWYGRLRVTWTIPQGSRGVTWSPVDTWGPKLAGGMRCRQSLKYTMWLGWWLTTRSTPCPWLVWLALV